MQKLQTEDLIDFYLPRDRKILPLNKIKEAIILSTDDKDYQSQSLIALSKLKNHGITDEQIISFGNLLQGIQLGS